MHSVAHYLRERFPLPAVITLAIGTAIWLVAVSDEQSKNSQTYYLTGLIAVTFLAFLLRQRVMDEFKDRSHDDANYPNRPLQRGIIKPKALVLLGLCALIIELSGVLTIGSISGHWQSLGAYLGVLTYSALTAREFFIPNWLGRHFNTYFVSHQMIFLFFYIWGETIFDSQRIRLFFPFMLAMAALEIMRKFELRRNQLGEIVLDTYLAVWGRPVSVTLLATFTLLSAALIDGWTSVLAFTGMLSAAAILLSYKSDSLVRAFTVLGFFAVGLVAFFS